MSIQRKRILYVLPLVVLCGSLLTGCGKKDDASGSAAATTDSGAKGDGGGSGAAGQPSNVHAGKTK